MLEAIDSIDLLALLFFAVVTHIAAQYINVAQHRTAVAWLTAFTFIVYAIYSLGIGAAGSGDLLRILLAAGTARGIYLFFVPTFAWVFTQKQRLDSSREQARDEAIQDRRRAHVAALAEYAASELIGVPDNRLAQAIATARGQNSPEMHLLELLGVSPSHPDFQDHRDLWRLHRIAELATASVDESLGHALDRIQVEYEQELIRIGVDPHTPEARHIILYQMLGVPGTHPEFLEHLDDWRLNRLAVTVDTPIEETREDRIARIQAEYEEELELPELLGLDPESHEAKQLLLAAEQKLMRRLKDSLYGTTVGYSNASYWKQSRRWIDKIRQERRRMARRRECG